MGKTNKDKDEHREDPHEKTKVNEEEVNDEIRQTFPASDPPSATRPGHEEVDEGEEE